MGTPSPWMSIEWAILLCTRINYFILLKVGAETHTYNTENTNLFI